MHGKGPRHERETIIVFNEEGDTASVWTASESVYRQLRKRGYFPAEDNERSASFEIPKRDNKLPRPKRVLSEKQLTASLKAVKSAQNARFSAGASPETGVQRSNGPSKG